MFQEFVNDGIGENSGILIDYTAQQKKIFFPWCLAF
jgi:hypothetical protein